MGGLGSGRQKGYNTKPLVEESFVLDLNSILRDGIHPRMDAMTWSIGKVEAGSIMYIIGNKNSHPTLTLEYTVNGEPIKEHIPVIWETQPYGGIRYWMECPLLNRSGTSCDNHCSKLYLPPGGKYFGCRECSGLTYHSCNTSHKFDKYYNDFIQKYGPYPRKKFNEEFSGKWYFRYFRTRKAAKKWYAKMQAEKGV